MVLVVAAPVHAVPVVVGDLTKCFFRIDLLPSNQ
jgi:hypothetical protein